MKSDLEIKNELHMNIDNSFNEILKNLGNIFNSMKFNEGTSIEEANNLVITNSASNITNEIKNLLSIINRLKLKHIQTFNNKKQHNIGNENKSKNHQRTKLGQLEELHNKISKQLKESKSNDVYKYCEVFPKEQKNNL